MQSAKLKKKRTKQTVPKELALRSVLSIPRVPIEGQTYDCGPRKGQPMFEPTALKHPRKKMSKGNYGFQAVRGVKLTYTREAIGAVPFTGQGLEFQLDQFDGFSSYVESMDCYRLHRVKLHFIPTVNVHSLANSAATTQANNRPICTIIDYDDSAAPAAIGDLYQYGSFVAHNPYKPFTISFTPRISQEVFAGVTPGFAQMGPELWIDCANDDVPHYGLKWGIEAHNVGQTAFNVWKIYITGYFDFSQNR